MKKVLIVTFSDNADHQDISFSMFESLSKTPNLDWEPWIMAINEPKVPLMKSSHKRLVDCPKRPGVEKETFDFIELFSIIRWVNKEKFDVIFFESLHVWNLAIILACHNNNRIYQMIHDLIPHEGDKQAKAVDVMNKVVCKMADYIVLANKKFVPKVTEVYGVDPARVKFVDMWRRFPDYTEPRYTKRVLFFGRMNPYKGVSNLIEIVKLCPEICFDVVGRVDSTVKDLVEELQKYPNVTLSGGYVSNEKMEEAFKNTDWVILPYNSATQSGVVIDGYRYGRPAIAFNVGAIAEQISEGISGFLIEPGDNQAFAKKIKDVTQMNKGDYYLLSKSAYLFGVQKYSATEAVDRFLKVVQD